MKKTIQIIMAMVACDNGDGGSSEAPATYQLYDAGLFQAGYQKTTNLAGTDNQGNAWDISFETETLEDYVTTDGRRFIQIFNFQTYKVNGQVTNTDSTTVLYGKDAQKPLEVYIYSSNLYGVVRTSETIPKTAVIGEGGTSHGWNYDNGTYETHTWEVVAAGNGRARLVETAVVYDENAQATSRAIFKSDISEDGTTHEAIMIIESGDFRLEVTGK